MRMWLAPHCAYLTGKARPHVVAVLGVFAALLARVSLTFSQALHGRRLHGQCRAVNARDRRDPRCARAVTRGKLSARIAAAGRRTLKFKGRVGARHLRPGRYAVTVRATGSGGSATHRLHFTIAS